MTDTTEAPTPDAPESAETPAPKDAPHMVKFYKSPKDGEFYNPKRDARRDAQKILGLDKPLSPRQWKKIRKRLKLSKRSSTDEVFVRTRKGAKSSETGAAPEVPPAPPAAA